MAGPEEIRASVEAYVNSFVKADKDMFLDALADNVEQEDPVGSPRNVGKQALDGFWDMIFDLCESIEFENRELYISGNEAALVFSLTQHKKDGTSATYDGVDVFKTDDGGKITEIKGLAAPRA